MNQMTPAQRRRAEDNRLVVEFVRESCRPDERSHVPTDELYAAYRSWCRRRQVRTNDERWFYRILNAECPRLRERIRPWNSGVRYRAVPRVVLTDQARAELLDETKASDV